MDEDLYGYGVVKRILSRSLSFADSLAALFEACEERHPHRAWDTMAGLDYTADIDAMRAWFEARLPFPDVVEVIWFAPWDVVEGFDLRGSSSWSRDPEDWDWWFEDDFQAGGYTSVILSSMQEVADEVTDAEVSDLTLWVLAIGYLCLAAVEIMRTVPCPDLLGGREDLWAVSGFPDAVYGVILGRVTPAAFEPFSQP